MSEEQPPLQPPPAAAPQAAPGTLPLGGGRPFAPQVMQRAAPFVPFGAQPAAPAVEPAPQSPAAAYPALAQAYDPPAAVMPFASASATPPPGVAVAPALPFGPPAAAPPAPAYAAPSPPAYAAPSPPAFAEPAPPAYAPAPAPAFEPAPPAPPASYGNGAAEAGGYAFSSSPAGAEPEVESELPGSRWAAQARMDTSNLPSSYIPVAAAEPPPGKKQAAAPVASPGSSRGLVIVLGVLAVAVTVALGYVYKMGMHGSSDDPISIGVKDTGAVAEPEVTATVSAAPPPPKPVLAPRPAKKSNDDFYDEIEKK